MNILLSSSSHDGPYWIAFNLETLNLELEHHKNLYDAIIFCLSYQKKPIFGTVIKKWGNVLSVIDGELCDEEYFVENIIKGEAEFSDPDSEEYDFRYKNITINPPFQIDAVLTLKTF